MLQLKQCTRLFSAGKDLRKCVHSHRMQDVSRLQGPNHDGTLHSFTASCMVLQHCDIQWLEIHQHKLISACLAIAYPCWSDNMKIVQVRWALSYWQNPLAACTSCQLPVDDHVSSQFIADIFFMLVWSVRVSYERWFSDMWLVLLHLDEKPGFRSLAEWK